MAEDLSADCVLWGETTSSNSNSLWSKDVFNNIEQDVIIRSIQNISFKKTFCDQEEWDIPQSDGENVVKIDDPMKQTVKLLKYKNDIRRIVDHNKLQPGLFDIDEQLKNVSTPSCNEQKKNSETIFFKYVDSDFVNGRAAEMPLDITAEDALAVLRSSVVTILAFVGFTETTILPLQVLTEVGESYIITLLKLLRSNVERERLFSESGFCDVIDRTFHEMGIGSVRNLVTYYQDRVLNLKTKKLKACQEELVSYEDSVQKLREEKKFILESNFQDPLEDGNLIIPELHVTSLIDNELLTESFETGLQMLQTMERQQLRNGTNSELLTNEVVDVKTLKRKRKI